MHCSRTPGNEERIPGTASQFQPEDDYPSQAAQFSRRGHSPSIANSSDLPSMVPSDSLPQEQQCGLQTPSYGYVSSVPPGENPVYSISGHVNVNITHDHLTHAYVERTTSTRFVGMWFPFTTS